MNHWLCGSCPVQHNLRLVLSQAHKYFTQSMSLSVFYLCQEGFLGLIHGIDKFDPRKGYQLSTYVIYWICNSILCAQTRSGHLLHTPFNVAAGISFTFSSLAFLSSPPYDTLILLCHMLKAIDLSFNIHFILLQHKQSIKRTSMDLLMEKERAPTHTEIMSRLGLGYSRYCNILWASIRPGSMQTQCRITGKELVENLVDSEDQGSPIWKFSRDVVLQCGLDDVVMLLITAYLGSFQKLALSTSESGFSCIVLRI